MFKNKEAKEVKFDENRPTLDNNVQTADAVLAHNWQPNSPAVDLRYPGVGEKAVNVVAEAAAAEVEVKEEKKKSISQDELDRRSKLDVSNPEYINPSLDHYKVK